eukprot:8600445-Heterocapsa_arctica.AAC.1
MGGQGCGAKGWRATFLAGARPAYALGVAAGATALRCRGSRPHLACWIVDPRRHLREPCYLDA